MYKACRMVNPPARSSGVDSENHEGLAGVTNSSMRHRTSEILLAKSHTAVPTSDPSCGLQLWISKRRS